MYVIYTISITLIIYCQATKLNTTTYVRPVIIQRYTGEMPKWCGTIWRRQSTVSEYQAYVQAHKLCRLCSVRRSSRKLGTTGCVEVQGPEHRCNGKPPTENRQRKTDKLTKVSGKSAASRQPSKRAINSSNLYKLRKFEYLPRVLTFYMAIQTCTYLHILTSWQHCCHSLAVEDNKIMKKLVGLCVWKEVSESTDKAGSCIVYWRRR